MNIVCSALMGGFAIALVSSAATAGTASGKVANIVVRNSDGLIYAVIDGPISGAPACSTKNYFMIKDEKSDTGKTQFAMLLAAKLSGQIVRIEGTEACTRWIDGEDIDIVVM